MTGEVIKIAAVVTVGAVLVLLIKPYRPEMGILTTIAAVLVATVMTLGLLTPAVTGLSDLFEKSGVDSRYFKVVLKTLAIAYLSGFAADTCRDFGLSSLASKAEFAGRCAILVMSLPLLSEILNTALGFAGV